MQFHVSLSSSKYFIITIIDLNVQLNALWIVLLSFHGRDSYSILGYHIIFLVNAYFFLKLFSANFVMKFYHLDLLYVHAFLFSLVPFFSSLSRPLPAPKKKSSPNSFSSSFALSFAPLLAFTPFHVLSFSRVSFSSFSFFSSDIIHKYK